MRPIPHPTHPLALLRLALAAALLLAPGGAARGQGQSEAELRLGMERARLVEQEAEDDLAVEERLAEEGLASEVELRRARSRLERSRLDTEMARAALTDALPPARLLSATRRLSADGQPEVRLVFERTGTAAKRLGQSVVVSILSDGLVVGRPYQALLRFPSSGRSTESLDFELIRDVDELTVATVSGSRRDEVRVPLEIDTQGAPVKLSSLNSSQDGQLGATVEFDVVVERASPGAGSVAIEVEGLPNGFTAHILDEEKRSSLRLVQFPQGVNRVLVVVRIDIPEQEDASWSDRVVDLAVRASWPASTEPLATIDLHLRPVGRPELSLVSDTLSVEVAPGGTAEIPIAVVNHGGAAAFEVQARLSEPIGLEVEADPRRISQIPAGDRATLVVRVRPRPEAVEGDYPLRVSAVTEQAGGYAESKDLTLRVTVRRKAPWAWLVLGALALLLVAVGLWWLRSRTAARGGG